MSALRRQLSATGWQAVGFFGASLIFAGLVFFWGQHIEGRIDTVVIQRQHDHRTLHHLVVHDAQELQAPPNLPKHLDKSPPTDSPSQAHTPSVAHQSPHDIGSLSPGKSGSHKPPKSAHNGGDQGSGSEQPTGSPADDEPASDVGNPPAGDNEPPESSTPPPSTASAPGVVGDPGGIVGEIVCSVNALGIRICSP